MTATPDLQFQQFLAEGRFMIQRCRSSGRHIFYPRVSEPATGAQDLDWVEASGYGVVYSTTVVRRQPPAESYNVALIDLDEGVRLMSRVVGIAPETVRIGLRVKARIATAEASPLLVFDPALSEADA